MELTIEKMVYGGDGLGRLAPDEQGRSKTVFVPFVLPNEKINAAEVENRSAFARAQVTDIESASPARVEPGCQYFGKCGGCNYQHAAYDEQLKIKADILRETLHRTAKLDLPVELQVHSAEPWNYRNRTRLKVRGGADFAIGYYKMRSHELLPVRECPISSPLINRAIAAFWEIGTSGTVSGAISEVQFFANHDDRELLIEVSAARGADKAALETLAKGLQERIPECRGVIFFEAARTKEEDDQTGPAPSIQRSVIAVVGERSLIYRVGKTDFRVSAGAFFQTNRFLVEKLAQIAVGDSSGRSAFDLYAGAGLFSVPLSQKFEKVTAVEASSFAVADLKANAPANVKAVSATTEEYVRGTGGAKPDLVLVDPPRAGLGEKTAAALGRMHASRVTYVSCDPSTLSRDLKVLLQSGFRVEQAHLVDLFPQTYHMESVFHLVR